MDSYKLTQTQLDQFHADGFLLVEELFDEEEIGLLQRIAECDQRLVDDSYVRADGDGGITRLTARTVLDDDIYSAFVRCPRLLGPIEQILEGEAYHWNHKMMFKDPRVGGAWEWHQDYGYWYVEHACLFPLLASCLIAVDPATEENGCIQAIRGSSRMGRVEHQYVAGQMSADAERVEAALERLELVHCVMAPGSALFFDGNLIHRSDHNHSDQRRWALICSYNAARNSPFKKMPRGNPSYSKLETQPDALIKQIGRRQLAALQTQSV
jgi:ectoine hydroxylase